jgi:hypothetical protein
MLTPLTCLIMSIFMLCVWVTQISFWFYCEVSAGSILESIPLWCPNSSTESSIAQARPYVGMSIAIAFFAAITFSAAAVHNNRRFWNHRNANQEENLDRELVSYSKWSDVPEQDGWIPCWCGSKLFAHIGLSGNNEIMSWKYGWMISCFLLHGSRIFNVIWQWNLSWNSSLWQLLVLLLMENAYYSSSRRRDYGSSKNRAGTTTQCSRIQRGRGGFTNFLRR